jgi:hypothetical protein
MCSYESNFFFFFKFLRLTTLQVARTWPVTKEKEKKKKLNIVEITKRESRSLNVVWM